MSRRVRQRYCNSRWAEESGWREKSLQKWLINKLTIVIFTPLYNCDTMQFTMNPAAIPAKNRTRSASLLLGMLGAIPLVIVLLLLLFRVYHIGGVYNPSWLLRLLNIGLISLTSFLVAYWAVWAFSTTGQPQLAWLGGGLFVFGLANLMAVVITDQPNLNVTVHNSGALLASIYFLIGSLIAASWSFPPGMPKVRLSIAAVIYITGILFVTLMFIFSLQNATPVFFVTGEGGTLLRQIILRSASALFAVSGLVTLAVYLRSRTVFLYWFSLGLLLVAAGLLSVSFQKTLGDPINWLGRGSQYVAGIYFLIGIATTLRESVSKRMGFTKVASTIFPASAQSYRLLVDTATEAIIALNNEGRIALWNSSAEKMFGYSAREAVGSLLVDLIVPESHVHDVRGWMRAAKTELPPTAKELTLRRKDGQEIPVAVSLSAGISYGAQVKVFVARDIADRRQAEEALKRSEEKYRGLFDNMTEAFAFWKIMLDDKGKPCNYIILEINDACEKLVGVPKEKLIGKSVFEIYPDADPQWMERFGIVALTNESAHLEYHSQFLDKWLELHAFSLHEGYFATVLTDITERKKAEQLKDDFIGMVSHELRTPLAVVTGALYTSLNKELPVEEKQQLLHDAVWGTEMLGQILDNLLELSRAQANRLKLTIKPVNILEVAASVLYRLQYKSAEHRFEIDMPPELTVQADPVRIELILRNLVDNAIKYSPSGGQVTVFAKPDGETLVAGVSDQGQGIPPEEQEKLFVRFHRSEQSVRSGVEGIGLGLSVCRTLVEAHGGRIWVESQPGQGSTFYFTIPIEAKPNAAGN
jgi:PAS domain S-box-containing protein